MSLPDEIRVSLTTGGLSFELRVGALPQGSERIFPDQICADEFRKCPDLRRVVAQAAAGALDEAVRKFERDFYLALSSVLIEMADMEAA